MSNDLVERLDAEIEYLTENADPYSPFSELDEELLTLLHNCREEIRRLRDPWRLPDDPPPYGQTVLLQIVEAPGFAIGESAADDDGDYWCEAESQQQFEIQATVIGWQPINPRRVKHDTHHGSVAGT